MRTPNVLVVDDDDAVREVATEMLKSLGCEVDVAGNGPAALSAVERARYDVVFLDVGMPGMSGADVYTSLRTTLPEQPVVFMTGYAEDELSELRDPHTHILLKPFTLRALTDLITHVAA